MSDIDRGLEVVSLDAFDVDGDVHVVPTRYGPLTVTVQGDPRARPLLTYHDVGLNHRTCFQPLFVCAGPSSDLVKRFRVHHIDAPGCQDGGVEWNLSDASPRTLDALAEQVEDVVKHFGLRECVGLGVGAGATVMALYAGRHSSACKALMLVAPSCGRAGTVEHALGAICKFNMKRYGWTPWTQKHLMKRMFSYRGLGGSRGMYESDLAQTARREMRAMNPRAVTAYYDAALHRLDNEHIYASLRVDAIIMACAASPWYKDSVDMNAHMSAKTTSWVEIEGCGTAATMEDPSALLSPINLFIQRLKSQGMC